MPQVGSQSFAYTRKGRRRAQSAASARGGGLPPSPKPGVPTGPPAQKSVSPLGPPKSTLPRKGNVGFQGAGGKMRKFDPDLVERLRKRLGKGAKGQGAYNLLHTKGKPSDALSKLREAKNRKSQFGGPDDGRKPATRRKKRGKASFGSASSV